MAGVLISHPDRVIYPNLGVTKIGLVRFYEAIGDWIVPHVRGRPLTLVHCPNGLLDDCWYMRHTKAWGPTVLRRVKIREKTKVGEYLVADDLAGVIGLIHMGIVEIHAWKSTADNVERPNRIIWDLDPGPDVTWTQVVSAALWTPPSMNDGFIPRPRRCAGEPCSRSATASSSCSRTWRRVHPIGRPWSKDSGCSRSW